MSLFVRFLRSLNNMVATRTRSSTGGETSQAAKRPCPEERDGECAPEDAPPSKKVKIAEPTEMNPEQMTEESNTESAPINTEADEDTAAETANVCDTEIKETVTEEANPDTNPTAEDNEALATETPAEAEFATTEDPNTEAPAETEPAIEENNMDNEVDGQNMTNGAEEETSPTELNATPAKVLEDISAAPAELNAIEA